jgi:NAD(P)-dependent dehydrogenase (short-subunit alcohol dehydrogenase family)
MQHAKEVAFITGANKGLGLEIARQLAKKGYTVVLGARDLEKGKTAAALLTKEGFDAHTVQADVANQDQIAALPGWFKEKFGRLDVLVNNAGVAAWQDGGATAFRDTFEANVFGAVAVSYALLPILQESPAGRIVNHSSILGSLTTLERDAAMYGDFINPAYTASKAALNGFTLALANQLRNSNVKVNAAHPGWVKTDLGGQGAPLEVAEGAETAVRLATLGADGPTGQFFHKGERLPW